MRPPRVTRQSSQRVGWVRPYRHRVRSRWAALFFVCAVAFGATAMTANDGTPTVRTVTVDPAFGRHVGAVRVAMTADELSTVRRMTQIAANPVGGSMDESTLGVPGVAQLATWYVEDSAIDSRTLILSRKVLASIQQLLATVGLVRIEPTAIVVARTQDYINDTLSSIGCRPDLSRTSGLHLMGEIVCNRHVIVINLTGYFFLVSEGDLLTPELESRREPAMRSTDYRIADRNISGLAHEWAHIARVSLTGGLVAADEPVWFGEGMAELLTGLAKVRAFPSRMSYSTFHVVRLRKFADWGRVCGGSLRDYRRATASGCEYHLGAMAVEYLVARMGGLSKLIDLIRASSRTLEFAVAFRSVYGVSLSSFERTVDAYLAPIGRLSDGR